MKNQDKELLLKDLCARLSYKVKYSCTDMSGVWTLSGIIGERVYPNCTSIDNVRPFLRPLSSMTAEERQEVGRIADENRYSPYGEINNKGCDNLIVAIARQGTPVIQYLCSRHFDVMGLIERGLALEAPEDMYTKE